MLHPFTSNDSLEHLAIIHRTNRSNMNIINPRAAYSMHHNGLETKKVLVDNEMLPESFYPPKPRKFEKSTAPRRRPVYIYIYTSAYIANNICILL